MKFTVTRTVTTTRTVSRCRDCPHFGVEGMEKSMVCNHPYWKDKPFYANYIISYPIVDKGFPKQCPLLKEK